MPLTLGWFEIAVRLFWTVLAGALIGLNRSERGHAAGLRTSILVCLAASIAMLQVNVLLPLSGRHPDSFVMNDLMRLPLGILSGMGFIGAGAIVRRDSVVSGITTAATLWFLTVIGLCFGGGQIGIGLAGTALGLAVLMGLKWLEDCLKQDKIAELLVVVGPSGPGEDEIRSLLQSSGFRISSCALEAAHGTSRQRLTCRLHWRSKYYETRVPDAVRILSAHEGVARVAWTPQVK
jgi:putative Mg2+ transporter-C (MgtC) family protein